jgi:ankyrin repeat protein
MQSRNAALEKWRRDPHRLGEQTDLADELLRLSCLTYGADDGIRPARAAAMLATNPELAGANIFTAAATGSVSHLRRFLAADPSAALTEGGPHSWTPLLFLCFSRIPDAPPERSSLGCAARLLDAGADPNAGFCWEGLAPPFTALTGAFGGGEDRANQPPHQHAIALARMLLDAGADPNDGQTLYNRMFEASDEHLHLLFECGLGKGDGGPWRQRLGKAQQSPEQMLADQLIWAVQSGRSERVAILLAHGVDPNVPGSGHPTHESRSAHEWAVYTGSRDIAALLAAAGARPSRSPIDAIDRFLAGALGEDADAVRQASPKVRAAAIRRRPGAVGQAVDLRRPGAVRLLVEAGFSVHGDGGATPLHLAAYGGDLEMVRLLVDLGADPNRTDPEFRSTALGWAEHAHADAVVEYLGSLSSATPRPVDPPGPAERG